MPTNEWISNVNITSILIKGKAFGNHVKECLCKNYMVSQRERERVKKRYCTLDTLSTVMLAAEDVVVLTT